MNRSFTWSQLWSVSQWDKIIFTLVFTAIIPLGLHALPFSFTSEMGARWLPMFYAPVIAALLFRPHVSLLTSCVAPYLNHLFFGMPSTQLIGPLTVELIFLCAMIVISRRMNIRPSGWLVGCGYVLSLFITLLCIGRVSMFFGSLITALPGILALLLLTEMIQLWSRHAED